jgi:hypothetical protein
MKSRPGLLFSFDDRREIAVPCPDAARMAAVFALAPAPGTPETAAQFVQRLIRQLDTILESSHWLTIPAGAAPISAESLTLMEARQLTNAVLAHYLGADAKTFTRSMETMVAASGEPELQHVPLGRMLEIFRANSV